MTPEEAKARKEKMSKAADSLGSIAGGLSGVITSTINNYTTNSSMADASGIEESIKDNSGQNLNYDNFDSLMSAYDSYTPSSTNYTGYGLRDKSVGSEIMSTIGNTVNAAVSGMAATKSPYGLLLGIPALASGIAGSVVGVSKREDKAYDLNVMAEKANDAYRRNFSNNAGNIKNDMFNKAALNIKAIGGTISPYAKSRLIMKSFKMKPRKMKYGGFGNYYAYGGDMSGGWSNGVTFINEGGTHESNPYTGVPMGVDINGTPNLVEEGEVVFNDYVFSNRLRPTKKQLNDVKLPEKYEGKTFAEIARLIQKESENNPLDPISKNTLVDGLSKLTTLQEEKRMRKAVSEVKKQINNMPEDELAAMINQSFGSPELQDEQQAIDIMNQNPRAYQGIRNEMNEENLGEGFAFGGPVNYARWGRPLMRYIPSETYDRYTREMTDAPNFNKYFKSLGLNYKRDLNYNNNAKFKFANTLLRYYMGQQDGVLKDDFETYLPGQVDDLIEYAKAYWDKYGSDNWDNPYLGSADINDEDYKKEVRRYRRLGKERYFKRKDKVAKRMLKRAERRLNRDFNRNIRRMDIPDYIDDAIGNLSDEELNIVNNQIVADSIAGDNISGNINTQSSKTVNNANNDSESVAQNDMKKRIDILESLSSNGLMPERYVASNNTLAQPKKRMAALEELNSEGLIPERYVYENNSLAKPDIPAGQNTENKSYSTSLPYDNSKGFKYFNKDTGEYDPEYLEWLDNLKFEGERGEDLYDELSELYEDTLGKELTKEEAIKLGKDKKFGKFHTLFEKAYEDRLYPELTDDVDIDDSYPEIKNDVLDIYSAPIKVAKIKSKDDDSYPRINALQYMPAIGSMIQALNYQKPDYSNADLIARGRRGIRDVRGRSIGHYLAYNPYDVNYEADKIRQTGLGTQRAMANTADNRGQALASMALLNNNINGQYGDLRRRAADYNLQQRRTVEDFNRQTDLQNAQFGMQADSTNSSLDTQRASLYSQEAQLRDSIESAVSQSNSQNMSNAITNLGNLGKQKYENDKLEYLLSKGYVPNTKKCGGKIRRKKGLLR